MQVLLHPAAVPGARWYRQHPGTGTIREREHDGDVSMMTINISDELSSHQLFGKSSFHYHFGLVVKLLWSEYFLSVRKVCV